MKIAILALAVVAIIGPAVLNIIAYKTGWTNPKAAGNAVRWAAIGGILILIAILTLE